MEHAFDFYKPVMSSEYPILDGRFSIECYLRALDMCYKFYRQKFKQKHNESFNVSKADYFLFHCPYTKLVQKAFARLVFNDFLEDSSGEQFSGLQRFKGVVLNQSYANKDLEQAFVALSQNQYDQKVVPTLSLAKELGNIYSGSLYSCLLSLISQESSEKLQGKRIVMFSYGSGLASSMFSLVINGPISTIAQKANVNDQITKRKKISPQEFTQMLNRREQAYSSPSYKPIYSTDLLWPKSYYLKEIDELYRRHYEFKT